MTAGWRNLPAFTLLGAISGAVTTGSIFALQQTWKVEIGDFLMLSPLSIMAGLVFGIIFGGFLRYRGLSDTRGSLLYALASTAAYFVAVNLAFHLADTLNEVWQVGLIAGLAGSACLTAAAAVLLPFVRRAKPIALMLVAGCLLGVLLELPIRDGSTFWDWLVLFVVWQAGYAAAFATALPERAGSEQRGRL